MAKKRRQSPKARTFVMLCGGALVVAGGAVFVLDRPGHKAAPSSREAAAPISAPVAVAAAPMPAPVERPATPQSTAVPAAPSRAVSLDKAALDGKFAQSASAPTVNTPAAAGKMTTAQWKTLDGALASFLKTCWSYKADASAQQYVPKLRVTFGQDGAVQGKPALLNAGRDPAQKALAASAVKALTTCGPMQVPAAFRPYYAEWKSRIVRFQPDGYNPMQPLADSAASRSNQT